ncbi:MAG: hypothetical protein IKH88_14955, partial [Prevotella sp.]|nr:hypothetical protein [Prevotella sp.]
MQKTIKRQIFLLFSALEVMFRVAWNVLGREATTIDATSVTDLVTYLWCCVVSACKRDGIAFDMSLMDFADGLDP